MYLKKLVAVSLSFPHFRVNILTVHSQHSYVLNYQSRDENLCFNALILLRSLSYIQDH